ncbi:hypothetical protein [Nocardia tengchongensis]|uniref:hypothetical protein n=1 Tax=Nocardia tengchongensis TaxID=2055889 RepID=UPI003667F46F
MRNLFDPSALGWPQLQDSLHVYVLPGPEFADVVQPAVDVIAQFDFRVPVAPQWMHATVTRIPWWRTEVDDRALREFGRALDAMTIESGDRHSRRNAMSTPTEPPLGRSLSERRLKARTTDFGSSG